MGALMHQLTLIIGTVLAPSCAALPTKSLASFAFSPDGKLVAIGRFDKKIQLIDPFKANNVQVLHGHQYPVWRVCFTPNGKYLVSGDEDSVRIWDPASGKQLTAHECVFGTRSLAITPDSKGYTCPIERDTIALKELITDRQYATFVGHEAVTMAAFNKPGTILATASEDKTIKLWDVRTQKALATLRGHQDLVWAIAFSTDDSTLFSASYDKTVRVWNVATRKERQQFSYGEKLENLAVSPDGTTLAVEDQQGKVTLHDLASGRRICDLDTNPSSELSFQSLAFSPDGTWLATGGDNDKIKLWEVSKLLAKFKER
jgi:WD40 repeat protein